MIYLSQNTNELFSVLKKAFGSTAIRNTIELYLRAYSVRYDFAQFYIQVNSNKPSALIMRYNSTVYCLADIDSDLDELSSFFSGYKDTEIISHVPLSLSVNVQECAVMNTLGRPTAENPRKISVITDAKSVATLVCENLPENEATDFFLNTAHQMRHNLLSVYGILGDEKALSVASVYVNENCEGIIPFVYTSQYFRGNGFSKSVLKALCSNPLVTYRLLCEEHNIEFYKKCGFIKEGTWYKYNL